VSVLLNAPRAFAAYGLTVELAPNWRDHDHGPIGPIRTIADHHTAGAARGRYPSYGVVRNGRAGLPGPLAQWGIARDGVIIVFSAGLCYHAGAVLNGSMDNYNCVGFEAESTGYGDWTEEQVWAYPRANAAIADLCGLPASRVLAHAEICSPPGRKIDAAKFPGGMNGMRAAVAKLLRAGGAAARKDDEDVTWSKWPMKDRNELVRNVCDELMARLGPLLKPDKNWKHEKYTPVSGINQMLHEQRQLGDKLAPGTISKPE